eukprot:s2488_g3.t1
MFDTIGEPQYGEGLLRLCRVQWQHSGQTLWQYRGLQLHGGQPTCQGQAETFGSKLPRPMSGVTFTFPSERRNSSDSFAKQRSNSLPGLPGVQSRSSLSQAGMALSS